MTQYSSQASNLKPHLLAASDLLNTALPYVVHIDLNSCFAIIEQQANRLLRGRPVGVAAYDTPRGFVLAASYEAKAKGIKLGVNVEQARTMCPGIVIMTPDPAKYREAHRLFKELMLEYTPDVQAKSIDEFVLDFAQSHALRSKVQQIHKQGVPLSAKQAHDQAMLQIGLDMKHKIRERLGEWVTVNIGIATNRFLAKYAAGFGKPDGMTLIDHTTINKWYRCGKDHACTVNADGCKPMHLVDLPGINVRYRARLRAAGIFSPTDFLAADLRTLKKQVFKSINGYHWYMRLRGHEVGADTVQFSRKSIGHQYALPKKTTELPELERLLMKLCEKTGRRLRKNQLCAQGVHVYLGFNADRHDPFSPTDSQQDGHTIQNGPMHESIRPAQDEYLGAAGFNLHKFRKWSHGEKLSYRVYSTQDIYTAAKRLLHMAEIPAKVRIMSVHVFNLQPWDPEQLSLFGVQDSMRDAPKCTMKTIEENVRAVEASKRLSDSIDTVNNRYGEFIITPALMLDMQGTILDRVAFGQVKDL